MFTMTRSRFSYLFSGNTEAYGRYTPPSTEHKEGEKEEGQCATVTSLLTEEQYSAHLSGTTGLGICPVTTKGECRFTVLDVDDYDVENTKTILALINEHKYPLFPFLSKSGGLHLYTFYEEPISADIARQNADHMRRCLGLKKETEIFPKQDRVLPGKQGSWINLPYFGGDASPRCMLSEDGMPVHKLDEAIARIDKRLLTIPLFLEWKNSLPLADAPPCLQTIYMRKSTPSRNNYLFNLACYFKAKYESDQFQEYIEQANAQLDRPLSDQELRNTIIASITKGSYTYRCKEPPICDLCDKKECRSRKYSVGDAISSLSYERLVQFPVDPPYYEWTINGKILRFYSEQEIIQQDKFCALCMRHLGYLPRKVKADVWNEIVNIALLHMEIAKVDTQEDITDTGQAHSLVVQYLKEMRTDNTARILLGKAFYNNRTGMIYFRGVDLIRYVSTHIGCPIDKRQLYAWLVERGVTDSVMKINAKSVRVYVAPAHVFYDEEDIDPRKTKITEADVEAVDWAAEEQKQGDY